MGRHSAPDAPAESVPDGSRRVAGRPAASPVRRVLNVVWSLLVLVVVALALAVTVLPAVVGGSVYVVRSGSMSPLLEVGSVAVTRSVPVESIRTGDVVAFTEQAPDGGVRTVVHRVTAVDPGPVLRTKGDANADPDPEPVEATSVTGRLWFDLPYVGTVAEFVRTVPGMLVAGGVVLLGMAVLVLAPGDRRDDGAR